MSAPYASNQSDRSRLPVMSGLESDHEDGAHDERQDDGAGRSGPSWPAQRAAQAAGRCVLSCRPAAAVGGSVGARPRSPSAGRCPPCWRVRPSTMATSRPRYMTPMRSDSSRTSSSSAETSSTAVPASRFAIDLRWWMNSTLPTSRPRVGWSRTSSLRSRPNSRATTTFCWLPPESVPAVHGRATASGRRTASMASAARSPMAASSRHDAARVRARRSSR